MNYVVDRWGLSFCQNAPSINANDNQNTEVVKNENILNPLTNSIGAVILSGLSGIKKNTALIKTPYPMNARYLLFASNRLYN